VFQSSPSCQSAKVEILFSRTNRGACPRYLIRAPGPSDVLVMAANPGLERIAPVALNGIKSTVVIVFIFRYCPRVNS
jgi:hypothetical protein